MSNKLMALAEALQPKDNFAEFPEGQISFGAASCPFQTEADTVNSDWNAHLTEERATEMARTAPKKNWGQGKIDNIHQEALTPECYIPGKTTDFLTHYKTDIKLAQEMGLENLHFGIEMSRIKKTRFGENDREAIDTYINIMEECLARDIVPIIDLNHFSLPLWARDMGGWESRQFVEQFAQFCGDMAREFKGKVKFWSTINEPDTYTLMTYMPFIPRENVWLDYRIRKDYMSGWMRYRHVRENLVEGHRLAYKAIKDADPEAQVGFTVSVAYLDGWKDPVSMGVREAMRMNSNKYFAPRMAKDGHADWIGMQYYLHSRVTVLPLSMIAPGLYSKMPGNKNIKRSDQGWELYPEGHLHMLKWLYQAVAAKEGIPILVSETGLADRDDIHREWYISESIKWTEEAIAQGIDVRAFCYWSLTDNFEWDRGRRPRYGLIEVDYENDLARRVRDGGWAYARIIEEKKKQRGQPKIIPQGILDKAVMLG